MPATQCSSSSTTSTSSRWPTASSTWVPRADGGGTVVCHGTPEQVAKCKESYTGKFLGPVLGRTRELQERLDASGAPEWVPSFELPDVASAGLTSADPDGPDGSNAVE